MDCRYVSGEHAEAVADGLNGEPAVWAECAQQVAGYRDEDDRYQRSRKFP